MAGNQSAVRRYPPLAGAVAATLLAAFVLPSALNVPQSNPTQTLEFAPVPPDEDVPPPPSGGNVDNLSLGTSTTSPGDAAGDTGPGLPPPPVPEGAGERPVTKRCVGDPPRQTEDPLSPPCVAHFDGDNGGATYQGVTAKEVTILFYFDQVGSTGTSRGSEQSPADTYVDLWEAPESEEYINTRALRRFQAYFNSRYQLYGRRAHFHLYYASEDESESPEGRRADALANIDKLDPFAVFVYAYSFADDYLNVATSRGVLNFGSRNAKSEEFFQRTPGLVWSYPPSLEQQAENFSTFLCRRVVDRPAVAAGDVDGDFEEDSDDVRRLGLLYVQNETTPHYARFADAVQTHVEECGGTFVDTATFPHAGAFGSAENRAVATQNMASFQRNGVTTIVWPGGYENEHSEVAGQMGYEPEWILAGDNQIEGYGPSMFQDQEVWHEHAWVVTPVAAASPVHQRPCYQALVEADPSWNDVDREYTCGLRTYYEDLRQLFTGIQVAGPKLTPETVDQGFHAIPPHVSANPDAPACYYLPGDYTCVKDATVGWWDRDGVNHSGLNGCYRLVDGGRRYTTPQWPETQGLAGGTPEDPCMTFQGSIGNLYLPDD